MPNHEAVTRSHKNIRRATFHDARPGKIGVWDRPASFDPALKKIGLQLQRENEEARRRRATRDAAALTLGEAVSRFGSAEADRLARTLPPGSAGLASGEADKSANAMLTTPTQFQSQTVAPSYPQKSARNAPVAGVSNVPGLSSATPSKPTPTNAVPNDAPVSLNAINAAFWSGRNPVGGAVIDSAAAAPSSTMRSLAPTLTENRRNKRPD